MRIEKIGDITFILGDCMDFLKDQKENSFDLAIVDTPYGIGEDGLKNHSRGLKAKPTKYKPKEWDKRPPKKIYFEKLKAVSKNSIIWGANHFIENIPFANSSSWIVWDKVNGNTDFADCELAYTTFKSAVRKYAFMWNGMLQGDMKNKEKRIHPTQKPKQLYKWLLQNYAKKGDKILDTHGGSGSIAIACYLLGLELTIIEKDEDYFNAMLKRFKLETAQKQLF
jgi:site-specific DNA-methyltransferase (adenine-specific)